ncbi:hypothetical protein EV361DRAFT_137070 [Lentinula raphanica]|nr:hypothetical protein EV361DRAFT_137070 [Lentinula raphanica]
MNLVSGQLKGNYIAVKFLRDQSGFGWDDELFKVTATAEVWDALLAKPGFKKRYSKWRNKPFKIYEKMAELVDGIYATGENAISGGTFAGPPAPPPLREPTAHSSDSEDEPSGITTPATPAPANNISDAPLYTGRQSLKRSHSKGGRSTPQSRSVDGVAGAINRLSSSFESTLNTPQRRRLAIQKFEEDGDFSDQESNAVYRLFQKDISVADTYVEIGKKKRRTNFLRAAIRGDEDDF